MEPVVIDAYAPALSALAERVLVYLQEDEQVQVGFADVWKICKKIRASFDDVKDAIYEIRKKESFFVKKITDEQRNDIIEKAKKGWSQNAIAKEYGVSQGAISFILRKYKPAAEQPENPTQAPVQTSEDGAITELADTTEQNLTESADAALQTAKKKPPQSVMDAVQQSVDCNLKLLDDLTERIQKLMEQRELLKHTNAEMLAWMQDMQEAKA